MAGAADLLVDLEAALQLRLIEFAKRPGEAPLPARRLGLFGLLLGEREPPARASANAAEARAVILKRVIVVFPWDRSPIRREPRRGAFFASTASAIEAGIGLVFSIKPSSGRTTRKKPK